MDDGRMFFLGRKICVRSSLYTKTPKPKKPLKNKKKTFPTPRFFQTSSATGLRISERWNCTDSLPTLMNDDVVQTVLLLLLQRRSGASFVSLAGNLQLAAICNSFPSKQFLRISLRRWVPGGGVQFSIFFRFGSITYSRIRLYNLGLLLYCIRPNCMRWKLHYFSLLHNSSYWLISRSCNVHVHIPSLNSLCIRGAIVVSYKIFKRDSFKASAGDWVNWKLKPLYKCNLGWR